MNSETELALWYKNIYWYHFKIVGLNSQFLRAMIRFKDFQAQELTWYDGKNACFVMKNGKPISWWQAFLFNWVIINLRTVHSQLDNEWVEKENQNNFDFFLV